MFVVFLVDSLRMSTIFIVQLPVLMSPISGNDDYRILTVVWFFPPPSVFYTMIQYVDMMKLVISYAH